VSHLARVHPEHRLRPHGRLSAIRARNGHVQQGAVNLARPRPRPRRRKAHKRGDQDRRVGM